MSKRVLVVTFISMQKLILIWLCLILGWKGLNAQTHMLQVQKLGLEDGLSSYNINNIMQDSRGFIWLSTDYGINRYDGVEFKSYTKEENGLCYNHSYSFSEDNLGNIWVFALNGAANCISILDPIKDKFYTLEEYIGKELPFRSSEVFFCITPDNQDLYFWKEATLSSPTKYYKYDFKQFIPLFPALDFEQQFPLHRPEKVHPIDNNHFVIFMWGKNHTVPAFLLHLDSTGKILKQEYCPSPSTYALNRIVPMKNNSYSSYCLNKENLQIGILSKEKTVYTQILGQPYIDCFYSDDAVYTINKDSINVYNHQGDLLKQVVLPINYTGSNNILFVDKDKNIWLTNDQNIYILNIKEQPFSLELAQQTPPYKSRGIAETKSGNLLTGSIGQFQYKDSTGWHQNNNRISGLAHNALGILVEDSTIWVGLDESILLAYSSPSSVPHVYKSPQMGVVWTAYRAKNGSLWVGTANGLYVLDEQRQELMTFNTVDNKLSKSTVYAFHENTSGTWLCTNTGLYLVDLDNRTIIEHYNSTKNNKDYIPSSHIAHLHEDKNGVFWLASKGDGLIRWNPSTKEYKQYTQKGAGLSHNVLYAAYGDDFENLWISSQRGLIRFNKASEHIKIYLQQDGLPHNEFNTIAHYQSPKGRLYFGGQNGIIHFHPKDLQQDITKAPLVITGYHKQTKDTLLNLTASLLEVDNPTITLAPSDKAFTLNFALLNYKNSRNHQYSYRIKGIDNTWNYQDKPSIQIKKLPYGNYELQLRAKAANSGTWISYPNTIAILVPYPFYLQLWFILTCIVFLILIIYLVFRWRIQRLEQSKKELEAIIKTRTAKIEEDKKLIEEQSEELKALDKVKSRFFANISHELRTPLTLILGPLSYLLDNPAELEKTAIQKQLLTMQRNGKSLMQLIEEILDLSKLEANKLELEEEATPVGQFFEHILAVFEPQLQSQGVSYELVLDLKNQQLHVLLDRKKMKKVLNNFLSNAIKFTPREGKITLTITETDKQLNIEVSDTGKGVHPNDLPYIFERFYQSKQADQNLYGGTGIGLALVQEFATLMQGKVYATSTLGTGSQFCFELSKKVVKSSKTVKPSTAVVQEDNELIDSIGRDFTILVVEDNPDMRAFVAQLLQERYKTVLTAQNGAEGLAKLKKYGTKIHLIVSDVMMPEVDGITMLKTIKSNSAWNGIPVIMLTALAAERDKLTALTIGVDDYLTKPFSVSELLVRVQNLLYNYHQRLAITKEEAAEADETALEQTTSSSKIDKEWIAKIETFIQESIVKEAVNVDSLSKFVLLSKRQLTRKLKALTGLTPAKFIREVQLQMSRKDLESGNFISVSEVAYNNGFDNPNNFSTMFKNHFGKTPSSYLK